MKEVECFVRKLRFLSKLKINYTWIGSSAYCSSCYCLLWCGYNEFHFCSYIIIVLPPSWAIGGPWLWVVVSVDPTTPCNLELLTKRIFLLHLSYLLDVWKSFPYCRRLYETRKECAATITYWRGFAIWTGRHTSLNLDRTLPCLDNCLSYQI